MKLKILILNLTIGFSSLTFGQENRKLPNNELKEIIELALNLPQLQKYFQIDSNPERLPLKLKEFGEINSNNLIGIKKFGTEILILKNEEIKQKKVNDYINIGDWTQAGNKLRLQLDYLIERITVNYLFERIDSKWKIKSTELWKE
ncbi:MAG: hypothetical protein MK202_02155 [Tenacibaculum sp.]|nr:hypothetical protein [Tenacibaculum sp.]